MKWLPCKTTAGKAEYRDQEDFHCYCRLSVLWKFMETALLLKTSVTHQKSIENTSNFTMEAKPYLDTVHKMQHIIKWHCGRIILVATMLWMLWMTENMVETCHFGFPLFHHITPQKKKKKKKLKQINKFSEIVGYKIKIQKLLHWLNSYWTITRRN